MPSRAWARVFSARVFARSSCRAALFPEAERHSLDSVIERHALPVYDRHRALGDARVLWAFVQALYRDLAPEAIDESPQSGC